MAVGALENSDADIAIAVTGIAGPDGGTPEKPVGNVFITWYYKNEDSRVVQKLYTGNQRQIREQTVNGGIVSTPN